MARAHRLIELTSREFGELAGACRGSGETLVALLPVGSVEQHGPALPLGTDILLAEGVCLGLASAWDDHLSPFAGIVLPALAYTNADSALDYPGTVSVSHEAQRGYGMAVLAAALRLDVDAVVAVNGHGPNDSWVTEAAFILNQDTIRRHEGRRPPVLPVSMAQAMRGAYDEMELPAGKHADWLELSLAYSVLGPGFFAARRKALAGHMESSGWADCPFPGVPLVSRSPNGVLGVGWPEGGNLEKLASEAWRMVFGRLRASVEQGLLTGRNMFGPVNRP